MLLTQSRSISLYIPHVSSFVVQFEYSSSFRRKTYLLDTGSDAPARSLCSAQAEEGETDVLNWASLLPVSTTAFIEIKTPGLRATFFFFKKRVQT